MQQATATTLLNLFAQLPPAEQEAVRRALASSPWQGAGPRARHDRAERRWQAVHELILAEQLPTRGKGAWLGILARAYSVLDPLLLLSRRLPPGVTLDTVAPLWVHTNTISVRALKQGYRRWLREQTGTNSQSVPPIGLILLPGQHPGIPPSSGHGTMELVVRTAGPAHVVSVHASAPTTVL